MLHEEIIYINLDLNNFESADDIIKTDILLIEKEKNIAMEKIASQRYTEAKNCLFMTIDIFNRLTLQIDSLKFQTENFFNSQVIKSMIRFKLIKLEDQLVSLRNKVEISLSDLELMQQVNEKMSFSINEEILAEGNYKQMIEMDEQIEEFDFFIENINKHIKNVRKAFLSGDMLVEKIINENIKNDASIMLKETTYALDNILKILNNAEKLAGSKNLTKINLNRTNAFLNENYTLFINSNNANLNFDKGLNKTKDTYKQNIHNEKNISDTEVPSVMIYKNYSLLPQIEYVEFKSEKPNLGLIFISSVGLFILIIFLIYLLIRKIRQQRRSH